MKNQGFNDIYKRLCYPTIHRLISVSSRISLTHIASSYDPHNIKGIIIHWYILRKRHIKRSNINHLKHSKCLLFPFHPSCLWFLYKCHKDSVCLISDYHNESLGIYLMIFTGVPLFWNQARLYTSRCIHGHAWSLPVLYRIRETWQPLYKKSIQNVSILNALVLRSHRMSLNVSTCTDISQW